MFISANLEHQTVLHDHCKFQLNILNWPQLSITCDKSLASHALIYLGGANFNFMHMRSFSANLSSNQSRHVSPHVLLCVFIKNHRRSWLGSLQVSYFFMILCCLTTGTGRWKKWLWRRWRKLRAQTVNNYGWTIWSRDSSILPWAFEANFPRTMWHYVAKRWDTAFKANSRANG